MHEDIALRWIDAGIARYPTSPQIENLRISKGALKLNIICKGLMFGYHGFGEAMRNITYSLYSKGCNVIAKPHDGVTSDILRTEKGRIISSLKNTIYVNDYKTVNIIMTSPLGVINRGGNYRIGYVMFETQETPKVFIHSLMANVDELWLPSRFNFDNFGKAGYAKPRFIMPLGVDTERFDPDKVQPFSAELENKFVFLSIMGWSARKGVNILIEAYLREFEGRENTLLYLKGGYYNNDKASNEVRQIISKVGKADPPKIRIDFNIYTEDVFPKLYKSANCFVLASLGEGWGLNYTEAMSMALPTIGTRATSQLDFMNDNNSFLIDVAEYRPEPKCNWICPQYVGEKFAIPSMEHLQKLMRQVYSDPELAKKKGDQARKDMVHKYQWKYAANKWLKRLKELEVILG
ncbi:glycosyltransferase [Candidatus Gottesmanbacteria bacterium]|nr:glycosyltransferase [Candidatus Gottesmanbacteria bacterium]